MGGLQVGVFPEVLGDVIKPDVGKVVVSGKFPMVGDDRPGHPVVRFAFLRRPRGVNLPEERFFADRKRPAFQYLDDADAVGRVIGGQVGAGECAESGQQVDRGDEGGGVDFSGRDATRPAGKEGHADTAFEERSLVAAATAGDTFGSGDVPARPRGGVVGERERLFA